MLQSVQPVGLVVVQLVVPVLVKAELANTRTVVLSVSFWGDPPVQTLLPWDGRTGHGRVDGRTGHGQMGLADGRGGQAGAQPPLLAPERPVVPG